MFGDVRKFLRYLGGVFAAYVCLAVGEFASSGSAPNKLSINAFLFLVGLGGLFVLLSPSLRSGRHAR
ncbi:hypothetical protein KDL44_00155 [bacterium]|nr:hypothetical protein [bacterium]